MTISKPRIFSIGELLVDRFPNYDRLGGAPCNFVYHAQRLGNKAHLISALGNDLVGHSIRSQLTSFEIPSQCIQSSSYPSGQVQVKFKNEEALYSIDSPSAWDFINYSDSLQSAVSNAQLFCFSTLAQRGKQSRETIYALLNGLNEDTIVLFDVNLRPPFYNRSVLESSLKYADFVKLNESELELLHSMFEVEDINSVLFNHFNVKGIIHTLGKNGSRWVTPTINFYAPSQHVDTTHGDSVGVGDAFFACIAHHLLRKTPHHEMLTKANIYAGYVATQKGAIMNIPNEIIKRVQ